MQFKDICSILEDVQLDQLEEGVKIVQLINSVLLTESESISITDTGLTLIGKYHIWSDELKLKINELNYITVVDFVALVKEIKQIRYANEAQRESDNKSKSQLIIIICVVLLCTIILKTCSTYERVEATSPEVNKQLIVTTEKVTSVIEP